MSANENRNGKKTSVIHQATIVTLIGHIADLQKPNLKLSDFQLTSTDTESLKKIREIFDLMLLKLAHTEHSETVIDLQSYLTVANNIKSPECSNVIYYKVLNQRCDNKETLLNVINDVYIHNKKHVFLEGDQATYERLQSIKREYGHDLSWMTPFPGDWHILKTSKKYY